MGECLLEGEDFQVIRIKIKLVQNLKHERTSKFYLNLKCHLRNIVGPKQDNEIVI